ncbi:MAG: ArsR/SmtB family transcription factor [Chloroflexota bacterium]
MPAPEESLIVVGADATVQVSLEPVHNLIHSLMLLAKADNISGLDQWIDQTRARMTAEEAARHRLVMIGFYFALQPQESLPSFAVYLEELSNVPAEQLRARLLDFYARIPPREGDLCHKVGDEILPIDRDAVLASPEAYLAFLHERFQDDHVDEALERQAYALVVDPPAMKQVLLSHLQVMWEKYLQPEWKRVRPMLSSAVEAFNRVDLGKMERLEAARFVTGQTLEDDHWLEPLQSAERVIFVPSAHVGPYLGSFWRGKTFGMIFGARLPAGTDVQAPDLSRAEIVVRLSALADDTRLRILKLIAEEGELRSQVIMEQLELSQSATSRHLKQLSATGYLSERRCAGAKCYRLNRERIDDTLDAVASFLIG